MYCGTIQGQELYPRIARRQQRTAPFSDSRGGRPCLDKTRLPTYVHRVTFYYFQALPNRRTDPL